MTEGGGETGEKKSRERPGKGRKGFWERRENTQGNENTDNKIDNLKFNELLEDSIKKKQRTNGPGDARNNRKKQKTIQTTYV